MIKKLTNILFALLIITSTAGCLEIEETTSISPNGECNMSFTMRVSAPANKTKDVKKKMREEGMEDMAKNLDGVTLIDHSVKEIYGQIVTNLKIHANKCSQLGNFYENMPGDEKPGAKPDMKGAFSKDNFYKFKKRGKKIVITRTIGPLEGKKKKKKAKKDFGGEFAAMMLGGMKLRFELDVPTRVLKSNAEINEGSRLEWIIPLSYLEKHKVKLTAEIESTPELAKNL